MTKLHLGCGERYFEGYINIDYPSDEHTVQKKSVADICTDITSLKYDTNSVDEIRLHHVFEHFTRPVACALVCGWSEWIKMGGKLHIEVPDFDNTCKHIFSPFSSDRARKVGLRHLFGSEEAFWAIHYMAYGEKELKQIFELYGFKIDAVMRNHWLDTYNVEVIGYKQNDFEMNEKINRTREFLNLFCLDDSEGEMVMLDTWMKDFNNQLSKM